MTSKKNENQYGLKRSDLSETIKRQVRQRCGFGCVICGKFPFDYEHFNPEFKDAKEHNPDGITLLCKNHHGERTNGLMGVEKVVKHNLMPKAKQDGQSQYPLTHFEYPFNVRIGQIYIQSQDGEFLKVNGDSWISVTRDYPDEPPLINLKILDGSDAELVINRGEIIANTCNWDFELKGQKFTIRRGLRDIFLEMIFQPPHKINIIRLNLVSKNLVIKTIENGGIYIRNGYTVFYILRGHVKTDFINIEENLMQFTNKDPAHITEIRFDNTPAGMSEKRIKLLEKQGWFFEPGGFMGTVIPGKNDPEPQVRQRLYKYDPEYFQSYGK